MGVAGSACAEPRPEGIPDSWVESSEWSCGCRLFLAPHGEDVEPIAWQPCDLSKVPGSEGYVCQQTADNFPADTNAHIGLAFDWSDTTRPPLLGFMRNYLYPSGRREARQVVARADGPIDFALSTGALNEEQGLEDCHLRPPPTNLSARHGEFVVTLEGQGGGTKNPIGVLRRTQDRMHMEPLYADAKAWALDVFAGFGPLLVARSPDLEVYRVDEASHQLSLLYQDPSLTGGLAGGRTHPFQGGAFLVRAGSGRTRALDVWTEAGGYRRFLHDERPDLHAYGGFGTDGHDLVWVEGHDAQGTTGVHDPFPSSAIMTAPFTTDPTQLKPRRLRSNVDEAGWETFAVGCGYAAKVSDRVDGRPLIIVRLSDGRKWELKNSPVDLPPEQKWNWAPNRIGLTCDEIFVQALPGKHWQIARIRLDSLGPGIAAD
ncbi:MAG: hypothetical protein EOO70_05400 [Myxococcaceae bacterium]|nr:MAG: hypothetical protein EOO70_05400 [Myxococcaceae bacterium]